MQEPIVDIMQLGLLVLFLWIQYRRRSSPYVMFWLVGWVAVVLSYVAWSWPGVGAQWLGLRNAASFSMMFVGALAFLTSLLPKWEGPRKGMYVAVAISAVNVLIVVAHEFRPMPKPLLVAMAAAWQGCGVFFIRKMLRGRLAPARSLMFAICGVYGAAVIAYVVETSAKDLDSWSVAEVLLSTAVLFWHRGRKGSIARVLGVSGFVVWAGFYFGDMVLQGTSTAAILLDQLWSIPKYAVAAMMVLKIFDDANVENAKLAQDFRELAQDFRLIIEMHPHPMWICDGVGGKFVDANKATTAVYGYEVEELKQMCMADLELPPDVEVEELDEELGAMEGARLRHRHKEGRVVWVNLEERKIHYMGKPAQFVIVHDITEQLKLHKELSHRAQHDMLTGLPNRQLFGDRLEQCLKACDRDERKAAVLTIDIDHFKLINDTYGHLVGDECLQVVASRLQSKIRKVDTIARTGGEEFMAVVSGLSRVVDAEKVAVSLLQVFELPIELSIGQVGVKVSVGVAVYPDDGVDTDTLRRLSDEALYMAKQSGRNRAAYAWDMARGGALHAINLVG